MLKTDTNPAGKKIYFDEAEHRYWTDRVSDFTSVTRFVESFFPVFEREKISFFYAKKHGLTQQEVLEDWDKKNRTSIDVGNNVHLFCEKFLLGESLPAPVNETAALILKQAERKLNRLLKAFDVVGSEKIVFSEELKLCGTADLLAREKKTGKLYLLDFKTNKKIERDNPYSKYANPPFSHLHHNNFTHYSVQLNLYRKLFHMESYFEEEIHMGIIHLKAESEPDSYRIPLMDNEIYKMVNMAR